MSNLNFENIKFAYSTNNTELPIRFEFTNHIENNKQSESTIDYSIDSSLNLNQEGYTLNITKNKISIVAKDEKGLFYAFITLDQLIEDSKDQNINLPMVSIKDYPSLKFRPIHIDVKHHMEKKSYYFNLIDHLAKQKIKRDKSVFDLVLSVFILGVLFSFFQLNFKIRVIHIATPPPDSSLLLSSFASLLSAKQ